MATYTPGVHLKKPAGTEDINVTDINGNMDIIDDLVKHTYISQASVLHPLDDEGYALSFESVGKMHMLTFRGKGRAHTEDEVFLIIPEGHRPPGDRYFIGSIGGTSVPVRMKANGDVEIYSIGGATQDGVRLYCSLLWMTE